MNTAPPRLLPLRLLAHHLGVPMTWLRQEADAGRLPVLRAGSRYLFDVEAVEQALLARAKHLPQSVAEGSS